MHNIVKKLRCLLLSPRDKVVKQAVALHQVLPYRVCLNKIRTRNRRTLPYWTRNRAVLEWWHESNFCQQTPRQLFWWDLWPTESKGGDKAIITNCLLWSIATVSDDYRVLYERKIVGIPTLCQISTYDSRTMSAFFVGAWSSTKHYRSLMNK